VRRYERAGPGKVVRADAGKLGNIPDGGGWRPLEITQGGRTSGPSSACAKATAAGPGWVLICAALTIAGKCTRPCWRRTTSKSAGKPQPAHYDRALT